MIRKWLLVMLVAVLMVPLAGCGRKSAPVPPPDSDHPRKYPTR